MLNLYPDCKVSEEHFQIKTYNEMGIMFKGGKIIPTLLVEQWVGLMFQN